MISYLMVGTNDLPRAVRYFDPLMQAMGASKVYDSGTSSGWGWGTGTPMIISEGEPGLRGDSFYAAYFRDPDGNKFNFICYL